MPTLTDEQIHHTPNEALMADASKIKEERRLLKERLEKLDATRDQVSASVYQRVRGDYVTKLNQLTEQLMALKKNLEGEQKTLTEKKLLIDQALQKSKETLEESSLRHALGEYSSAEHEKVVRHETAEGKRLEAALAKIQDLLDQTNKIFEGEDFLKAAPPPKKAAPSPPPPPPPLPKPEAAESGTMKFREAELAHEEKSQPTASQSQRASKTPQLQILENGKVVQTIPVDKTIQIGRSPANDVVLKEAKVSRKHAEIHLVGEKYILLDLESSNGTYVGGKKITEQVLQANDEILIGNTKMVFNL